MLEITRGDWNDKEPACNWNDLTPADKATGMSLTRSLFVFYRAFRNRNGSQNTLSRDRSAMNHESFFFAAWPSVCTWNNCLQLTWMGSWPCFAWNPRSDETCRKTRHANITAASEESFKGDETGSEFRLIRVEAVPLSKIKFKGLLSKRKQRKWKNFLEQTLNFNFDNLQTVLYFLYKKNWTN